MRVLGYLLFTVSLVAAVLVFTYVEGYDADRGMRWNLANAYLLPQYEDAVETLTCPGPIEGTAPLFSREPRMPDDVPEGCPATYAAWSEAVNPTYVQVTEVKVSSWSLGSVIAALVGTGAIGLGLLVYARR